jgi:hypothetical protein
MSYRLSVLAILIIAVAGLCAEPAPTPSPEVVYYHPVTVGTKWVTTYSWGINGVRDDTSVVTAAKDGKDGAKIVTIGFHIDGKTYPEREVEVSDRGLLWTKHLGPHTGPPHVPSWELKLPHKEGQRWVGASPNTNATAHGPEKVKVPAGEFDCIRVEERHEGIQEPFRTRWYSPGVGMVKEDSLDHKIVLKSITPGKE